MARLERRHFMPTRNCLGNTSVGTMPSLTHCKKEGIWLFSVNTAGHIPYLLLIGWQLYGIVKIVPLPDQLLFSLCTG